MFSDFRYDMAGYYAKLVSPFRMVGKQIKFAQEVQQVGLTRSPSSSCNPHILGRFEVHTVCPKGPVKIYLLITRARKHSITLER